VFVRYNFITVIKTEGYKINMSIIGLLFYEHDVSGIISAFMMGCRRSYPTATLRRN
jgi:hypothetical protein